MASAWPRNCPSVTACPSSLVNLRSAREGGAMAGVAGALYAHYIRIVDPDVFLFIYTVTMVIMVVTGGKGTGCSKTAAGS